MNHLLIIPEIARPWWPTNQRFPKAPKIVFTDCCSCNMRRSETISRIVDTWEAPLGGDLGCYQEPPVEWGERDGAWAAVQPPTAAYYEPRIEIKCAPGKGCDKNPKKRRGRYLREIMHHGV